MTDALIDSVALWTAVTLGALFGGQVLIRRTRARSLEDVPSPAPPWGVLALGGAGAVQFAVALLQAATSPPTDVSSLLPIVLGGLLGATSVYYAAALWQRPREGRQSRSANEHRGVAAAEAGADAPTLVDPLPSDAPALPPAPSRLAALLLEGPTDDGATSFSADPAEFDARVMHANRMQSIGRLAGGIAHDFNNLLTSILTSAELAREAVPDEHGITPDLEEIRRAGTRASELTRQLLAFARRDVSRPRVLDANTLLANLAMMLRRLLGETITLHISLGNDLPLLLADPAQLEQVIVNLAVNARDAMPHGGELQLRSFRGAPRQDHGGATRSAGVVLEVQDTGLGMSAEVRQRLFEPFFTTKMPGRGTGLGLATCHAIITAHNGEIEVESVEGRGSTFRVWLPSTEERDEGRSAATFEEHPRSPGDAAQVILLVEDDGDVRASTARALRRAGYVVLDAGDGEEALQLVAARPTPVDLVVTDVVMPRLGGAELARRLQQRWPELPVLFMSGYPGDSPKVAEVEATGAHVLEKPYTPTILLFEIRLRLDATRPA
ncbi:MAG: response regulator [Gemmatimonadetes bacterium]|nr:response regulator [Gemmatimonadota bacterium]